MINSKCMEKEYIESIFNKYKKINPSLNIQIMEKSIYALYLLELLVKNNIKFIFKGGTALTLLLNDIKRLSIDIDIIIEEENKDVLETLNHISNNNLFIRCEHNKRDNTASKRMKLEHYKFFFISPLDNQEKYVLLDIAYEKNIYPEIVEKEIICNIIENTNDKVYAKMPSVNSILGDKLCVIAPDITGINYFSNKELELMKQLYDVDKLFDDANNFKIVKQSFINISTREIEYRKIENITYKDVLLNANEFAKIIVYRGSIEREKLNRIEIGVKKLKNFILVPKLRTDIQLLIYAAKVMYLVSLLNNDEEIAKRYDGKIVNIDKVLPEHKKLIKSISKFNNEACFYLMESKYFE